MSSGPSRFECKANKATMEKLHRADKENRNAVAPGYINTPTNAGVVAGPEAVKEQEARIALGRMGTADEVADVVAFLFSEEARYMTGSVVEITGGRA